jgi:serine/threonine-protein kinase
MSGPAVDDDIQAAQKRVGQTMGGKWRLDRLLGVGGMAAVYAATHKNNLKTVAVKILHTELQRNEAVRTRFLREGYVANKVGHPRAVSAIDDGIDDSGAVFIVMELLKGQSLAQRLDARGGKLPQRDVLQIADGILDVLAAAHAQGIVHRDLKPDNVFLTEDDTVKVLDFGVARVLDSNDSQKTRTGVVMGTPEYMPPEQARGRSEHIDGRTDLWATAAMMHRLITGRYVHEAETQNEVLLLAMTSHAKKIADVAPHVHPKVAEIIDRALSYEPLDRFQDAESMRKAVAEAIEALDAQDGKETLVPEVDDAAPTLQVSEFVKAKTQSAREHESPKQSLWVHTKATPPEPPKAPKRKRPLLPILAASAGLAFVCVGIAWGVPRMRGEPSHPVASSSSSAPAAPGSVVADTDLDADVDAGEDEVEIDDEDAAPAVTPPKPTSAQTTSHPPQAKPKPKVKKKHR